MVELENLGSEQIIPDRILGNATEVDGRQILYPYRDGAYMRVRVEQHLRMIAKVEAIVQGELTIVVEVLNGTDVAGLARSAAQHFIRFGMEVPASAIGNADHDQYATTVVLDRKGVLDNAKRVAEIIKCDKVYSRLDSGVDPSIDVTVVLGRDFDGEYCRE